MRRAIAPAVLALVGVLGALGAPGTPTPAAPAAAASAHQGHGVHDDPAARVQPQLAVTTTHAVVAADRVLRVRLSCSAAQRCTGQRWLRVGTVVGRRVSYSVPARRTQTVSFTLTSAQLALVPASGAVQAKVGTAARTPARRPDRHFVVALRRPATAPVPATSYAYTDRNWTPSAYDTCSAALHRSYAVVGPDGKLYPGWHPPVVTDPATGESCTFGHEHGDDPRTSDVYDLVVDQFRSLDFPDRAGLPFGYVSEQLTAYAGQHADVATRHEDNVGHKVIVRNDVRLVAAEPRGYVYTTDADGNRVPVTCDFLMKVHQGSHSADATANNAHELVYAAACNDGTRLVTSLMTRFGNPNEFTRSCDASVTVPTSGSNLPAGDGGRRRIPDRECIDDYVLVDPDLGGAHTDPWGVYEVWESTNRIVAADGRTLAAFDPWFGVRNPARYYDAPGLPAAPVVGAAWLTDPADGGVVDADPWLPLTGQEPFAASDPRSPFDGAERDFYLGQTVVTNDGGPTRWWTDPYGEHGGPVPFVGAVPQLVSATDTSSYPFLERRTFDKDADFGDGQHVHAPN
ncbi:hypothetical protein [Nocardioides plantarum]|uniref:Uncharacterized protein n=1 Tax=Nocardioides plantarum TaxID=29299 RepID=A0ABV5KCM0_9ACTN|nr:hypothetical protein [Nocardioides plantarum]